ALCQAAAEVMALSLRCRAVDDADGAFEPNGTQHVVDRARGAQRNREGLLSEVVEETLEASGECWAYLLALRRPSPLVGGRHRALTRREAHEETVVGVALAHQLPHGELAPAPDLARPGV